MAIRKINLGRAIELVHEGATEDDHETTLHFEDATHDNALTFPNKSGTMATADQITEQAAAMAIALGG
tara:strand:- start:370 stop:573 length:204 start_codon:yes stop_codon:yes gene_type:complete